MGDTRSINYGRKPLNTAGLEFASNRKSRFAQYTQAPGANRAPVGVPNTDAQPVHQQHNQHQPAVQPQAVVSQPMYASAQSLNKQPGGYQEVAHDKVLYPQLSPIDTVEVPVLPDDTVTNDIAFDVSDTLDESDEFFADMPKSSIKRPGKDLKQESTETRKKGFKRTLGVAGLLAGVAVLLVSVSLIQRYSPPVSASTRKKAGYPVYQLRPSSVFAVQRGSVEFNENSSLVYKVKDTSTSNDFVFSQQKLPKVVEDDSNYQQFLTQSDKFASFDTHLGKAYFTKPEGIGSDVSIVLKSDKTILFIRGSGNTSEQAWSQLIGSLKLQ